MNLIATGACFFAALLVCLLRGAGCAFALVYLPALLLLSGVEGVPIPGLPDASPPLASVYGILLGGALAGHWPRFQPTAVDALVLLLLASYVVSALTTEGPWAGISIFGSTTLELAAPYFIARAVFRRRRVQIQALTALVGSIAFIALFALVEMRFWPQTYAQFLASLGLAEPPTPWVARRFDLFRARASLHHPIDLGNSAALVVALIFMLANRAGIGLRHPRVILGLCAALVASFCGLSFSSFFGLGAGLCLFLVLSRLPSTHRLVAPGVALLVLLGFLYAAHLAKQPVLEVEAGENAIASSYRIRQLILHRAWETAARAGPFGKGKLLDITAIELESVDNSYILIAMQRGFVSLGLWLALPVCLAALVSRRVRRSRSDEGIRATLGGFSAAIGTMVAMFTVWFGFVYASLFMVMLGLTVDSAEALGKRVGSQPRGVSSPGAKG